jgi:L-iditol 2-dehydrogenase
MKALVLQDYKRFEYVDVPEPIPGDQDVTVHVRACGICGSDVHGMDGSSGRRIPPIVMGHEASGTVVQVGRQVTEWRVGDRVTFDSTIYCGRCTYCKTGRMNLCDDRRVLGVSCDEYRQPGAFADRVVVPSRILHRLPDGISFIQGALAEPVSIAAHAVSLAPPEPGHVAVVVGAGMIGLLLVQILKHFGCRTIVAVDLDAGRLAKSLDLGADVALDAARDDVLEQVGAVTAGRGADLSFEVVGITPTVRTAVLALAKGGRSVLVGNLSPFVELPLQAVVTRQLSLTGSAASAGEYPQALDMIARGSVNVDAIISAIAPLHEGPLWFERLYAGDEGLLKVILEPVDGR